MNWLNTHWEEFLIPHKVNIGGNMVVLQQLQSKINLFLFKEARHKEHFSIYQVVEYLVNHELLPNEIVHDQTSISNAENDLLDILRTKYSSKLNVLRGDLIKPIAKKLDSNPKLKVINEIVYSYSNLKISQNCKLYKQDDICLYLISPNSLHLSFEGYVDEEIIQNITPILLLKYFIDNHQNQLDFVYLFEISNVIFNKGILNLSSIDITIKLFQDSEIIKKYDKLNYNTSRRFEIFEITNTSNVINDYNKLINYNIFNNPRLKSSIDRLIYSINSENLQDIILNLVISYETLLLQNKDVEIGFRLALYATFYGSDSIEEIDDNFEFIKTAYSKRSDVAHGNVNNLDDLVGKIDIIKLFSILTNIISKIIDGQDSIFTKPIHISILKEVKIVHEILNISKIYNFDLDRLIESHIKMNRN